ncbi:Dirigent protein 2 [Linum grandiflorum]
MAKQSNLLITPLILLIITISTNSTLTTTTAATFSKKTSKRPTREKQTHLHFYFHDIITSTTPTAYPLNHNAVPGIVNSSTLFGVMVMADDPLTAGPELNSTLVGRAQGMYGSAALTGQTAYFMVFNFVFVAGEYEGSTISLYGRNAIFDDVREMPVVGGTGVFRFARGYAEARTYKVDTVKFNVVVEYDVYVSHYF